MIWIEQLAKHDLTWFIFYIYPNIMCLEEMLVSEERWVIWSRNLVHKQRWMVTSHLIMLKQEQLELLQNVKYLIFFWHSNIGNILFSRNHMPHAIDKIEVHLCCWQDWSFWYSVLSAQFPFMYLLQELDAYFYFLELSE